MACTEDDHDTTDPFCGACGEQLHEPERCEYCAAGQHDSNGSPFCQCCGKNLNLIVEIEHEAGEDCVCGPTCEPVERDDGSIGWLYIHHSLDGREFRERPSA